MTPPSRAAEPRAVLAAFLSFLFPGLGQAYNRQPRLAAVLAGPIALVLGVALLRLAIGGGGFLSLLLDKRFLIGLLVLDLTLLGWRLVAVLQAHGRREAFSPRRWTAWVTGLLVVATLGMHLLPAWYTVKAIDTLGSVARGGAGGFGDDLADLFPHVSGLPEPSAPPAGVRVNILLVGMDSLPDRTTALTDTMLVVSLATDGGPSAMISVPRDLYGVPLPDGTPYNQKLNSLMSYAAARPAQFPLGGAGTLKGTIGRLLGIPIHYFAAMKILGFKDAIDAVGGVDVTVARAVNDPTYFDEYDHLVGFYIKPGTYHMDGHRALAYVRSRKGTGDSDFTRADRQQQLLTALQQQLTAGDLLLALPGLLDTVKKSVATDVPGGEIPLLAQAIQDADIARLRRIVLQPPTYMSVDAHSPAGYILLPDLPAIRAVVAQLIANLPSASPSP